MASAATHTISMTVPDRLAQARELAVVSPQGLGQRLGLDRWMVARSPAMLAIGARAQQLAQYNLAVLLLGESGAGKEVVARMIHDCSPRRHYRFLKINCAALPNELLESELFGYEAGAFTGAVRAKPGLLEQCDQGTLLLDEVGELPLGLQAKLLHVLQDHRYTRLGGRTELFANVRILAATNVNLKQAMAERRFREDLYYRLNVFSLGIPPLRERREDIPALMEFFLEREAAALLCPPRAWTDAVRQWCVSHAWPGNVRELENFVRRYLIFGDTACAEMASGTAAPPGVPACPAAEPASVAPREGEGLKEMVYRISCAAEREAIARALDASHWNRTTAARRLRISYRALLNKLRLYQLAPPPPVSGL